MKKFLALVVFGLFANAAALIGDCPLTFAGGVILEDPHHVGYILEVKNPSKKPVKFNVRVDFNYKGKKLQGGFETITGILPPFGKKTFKGSEPFLDKLQGVSELKLKLRKCDW